MAAVFKPRQKVGKYVIERRLDEGGFAVVYRALDTVEGRRVALKVPHAHLVTANLLEDFRREVRLAATLDHPNILPVKDASMIDGRFVIVFPLGEGTLTARLRARLSRRVALDFCQQMLEGVAYAHRHRIIHCDIKPDNFVVDSHGRLRLTDFGVARVAQRTVKGSGTGTVGYIAPEQAMGKPSLRSDVFSVGLVLWRMLSGRLPEWPFEWPLAGHERLRGRLHPDMIALLRRAIQVDPRKRFRDAEQMLAAFLRVKPKVFRAIGAQRRRRQPPKTRDWREVRTKEFQRTFGKVLGTRFECAKCGGPVSEVMGHCPWCGTRRTTHRDTTSFPARCPRCKRGVKADWTYCPWCWGGRIGPKSDREYPDVRYEARCSNAGCTRKSLMPFMRYCPWCHRRVAKEWRVPGSKAKCPSCGWGIADGFWSYCPWCGKAISRK